MMSSVHARMVVVLCLVGLGTFPKAQTPTPAQQPTYDILIRNGRIVDGTGAPWYYADVAISNGRIAAIGGPRVPREPSTPPTESSHPGSST